MHGDKFDFADGFRTDLVERCKILPAQALQLILPSLVRHSHGQYSVGEAHRGRALRRTRSTSKRPRQHRRTVSLTAQRVGENLSQRCPSMLHGGASILALV